MTFRNGQWTNRPDPFFDHSHEYPNSNVLREGPNQTKPFYDRWWVVLFQLAVIAAAIILCMNEAGCFDK